MRRKGRDARRKGGTGGTFLRTGEIIRNDVKADWALPMNVCVKLLQPVERAFCASRITYRTRRGKWEVLTQGEVFAARTIIVLTTVAFVFTTAAWAFGTDTAVKPKFGMALPGERCRIGAPDIPKSWTQAEAWAWKEICEGRNADFNKRLMKTLDPDDPNDDMAWMNDNRALRPDFLKSILLNEPFRSAIPYRGVYIVAAYFQDDVRLNDAPIERPLVFWDTVFHGSLSMLRFTTTAFVSFEGSRFEGKITMDSGSIKGNLIMRRAKFDEVHLRGARIGGQVFMDDSTFMGKLGMETVSTGGSLFMRNARLGEVVLKGARIANNVSTNGSAFMGKVDMSVLSSEGSLHLQNSQFHEVDLTGARIRNQVSTESSTFAGKVVMNALSTAGSLHLENSEFNAVDLTGAKIGDQASMEGSRFRDRLMMSSISVGSSLIMRNAEFHEVDLTGAKITDQLTMEGCWFREKFNMGATSIGGHLFMLGSRFDQPADLTFLIVGSNLNAVGAAVSNLDLTGSRIAGELHIGSSHGSIQWRDQINKNGNSRVPKLTLTNASIGVLQDSEETWPDYLQRELEGFRYNRLGGLQLGEEEMPYKRGTDWFVKWLGKDTSYSPQPYRHLARLLRNAGHETMANDVLFASRERERSELTLWQLHWWGLTILSWVIGYGYGWRHFLALRTVAIIVLVGTAVLFINGERDRGGRRLGFWYSLDMLLPVIHLREQHYKEDLNTWAKYYFYFHKIAGYVLMFFVAAGLTGLTE